MVMKRPNTATVFVAVAAAGFMIAFAGSVQGNHELTEAPAGFDLADNGFAREFCANQLKLNPVMNQAHPPIPSDECSFATALEEFTGPEGVEDGVGPVFNAPGCGECHAVPVIGGFSQTVEKRAGYLFNGSNGIVFRDPPGGSLIHDRALDPSIQELVPSDHNVVVAFRATISVLGDGFVEAIAETTLKNIAASQPSSMRGQVIQVPVLEAGNNLGIGRFGWKNQHASLVSFSADAYLNEMGITSPTLPVENTSNGNDVGAFDSIADPDDEGVDVELFALFMRATKVPPRGPDAFTAQVQSGGRVFDDLRCGVCHTRTIVTAAPGTSINGGALLVANALGNRIIHPFSDYLLHDIGTGDGIVQNGGASTRNKLRTSALWGLRARGRFMHDGLSLTLEDAIQRHRGQADSSRSGFNALPRFKREQLLSFLRSL
jgi:CxxC motif-containing protein (DUF1111 family)